MKRIVLLNIFILINTLGFSQFSLNCTGTVEDLSGNPIANHLVSIKSLDSSFMHLDTTYTNALGIYSFSIQNSVPSNNHPFRVSTLDCQGLTQNQLIFTNTTIVPTFFICSNNSAPHANFVWALDSTVQGLVHFQDSSQGNIIQWTWTQNNAPFSTLKNPSFQFQPISTNLVCLVVQDSLGSSDSICKTVKIKSCSTSFSYTINGTTVNFQANASPQANTYFWDFGDGQSQTTSANTIQHNYNSNGSFIVELQSMAINGTDTCLSTDQQTITISSSPTGNLSGSVFMDTTYLQAGSVYLYEIDSNTLTLNLHDSTQIHLDSSGVSYFYFTQLPYHSYVLKAVPDNSLSPSYYETWSFNAFNWQKADIINVNNIQNQALIFLRKQEVFSSGGNGKISGYVKNSNAQGMGMSKIYLLSTDSLIVDLQKSNSAGYYEFVDLAFGSYLVYPELDGIQSLVVPVEINPTYEYHQLNDFIVSNSTIVLSIPNHIEESTLHIFPNPFVDELTVQLVATSSAGLIELRDIAGKLYYKTQFNPGTREITIKANKLKKGVYFLKYVSENELLMNKIIKL